MYHVNPKTGNPNICRSKACELEHFQTREEALDRPSLDKATDAVKKELAKDEAVEENKASGKITTENLTLSEKESIASEIAEATDEPVTVEDERTSVTVHPPKVKKKKSKKAMAEGLAHDVLYNLDRLAKVAPNHPLVKQSKKAVKKFRKSRKKK